MRLAYPVTITPDGGPTWGYGTVSQSLYAALEAAGVTWDPNADVALHVIPPHFFRPIPGKRNAILTMTEYDQVTPAFVAAVNQADLVLVPCQHNRTVFRWGGVRVPIRVVPLGLGAAHCAPVPPRPARPIRFLWVGQADTRKGPALVNAAFAAAFSGQDDVQLVMKTVPTAGAEAGFTRGTGRVLVIAKALTDDAMATLYRSAHVFVFPSYGEGWGMPVLEAMAAGCLVLAPMHTGLLEFFDGRVGWPLPWTRVPAVYGVPVSAYGVDPGVLAGTLRLATRTWREAGTLGPLGARARTRALGFTWAASAQAVQAALTETWGKLDTVPPPVVDTLA